MDELERKAGAGMIIFNDKKQVPFSKGVTYAYHLMFSRDEIDLNQLSFGISGGLIQSQLDETSFRNSGNFDPIINGTIVQDSCFNVDIGAFTIILILYAWYRENAVRDKSRDLYRI
jgi:hypothetical protein